MMGGGIEDAAREEKMGIRAKEISDRHPFSEFNTVKNENCHAPVNISIKELELDKLADDLSALGKQIGGTHYKNLKIQPMTYSMENGLNACQHTAIKYITRYKSKGGIEDLRKAIHSIELLIEFEEKGK